MKNPFLSDESEKEAEDKSQNETEIQTPKKDAKLPVKDNKSGDHIQFDQGQMETEFQTPQKNPKSTLEVKSGLPEAITEFKVVTGENFNDMKEEENCMYIFTEFSREDIEYGVGTKYPAVNRKIHRWATRPTSRPPDDLPVHYKCAGLENEGCKALRSQYYCNKKCHKSKWLNFKRDPQCCTTGNAERKLVVVFRGTHTCKAEMNKITSLDDVAENIAKHLLKDTSFKLCQGRNELPENLGDKEIYLLPLDPEKKIHEQIKCGRRFGKFKGKRESKNEKKIFGEATFTKKAATCRGFYKCRNTKCSFFERFNAINQVI